ncbi:MAG: 50S ribosomal protein L24 [Bacteroidales bacterium]|nr:50S ribosomal protein L24 [Bacteroidales bacterium]
MSKIHIRKDDTVYVLSGEDRGKQGRVLSVDRKKGRAIVEGINIITKAMKPNAQHPQGGLIKMEAPIRLCKLALIDPKTGKHTRVGYRINEDGKKVRYSKKSGEEIK